MLHIVQTLSFVRRILCVGNMLMRTLCAVSVSFCVLVRFGAVGTRIGRISIIIFVLIQVCNKDYKSDLKISAKSGYFINKLLIRDLSALNLHYSPGF